MKIAELYRAIQPVTPQQDPGARPVHGPEIHRNSEFGQELDKQVGLSKHAQARIQSREIDWSPELEGRISEGMKAAGEKGSQSALILADDVAVIANVKTRTVVTAMDKASLKERVFTNIDSAVVV